jgi:hypothetical protein
MLDISKAIPFVVSKRLRNLLCEIVSLSENAILIYGAYALFIKKTYFKI